MTLFHLKFGRILDYPPKKDLIFEMPQFGQECKCSGLTHRYLNKVFTFTLNPEDIIEIIAKTKSCFSHAVPFGKVFIPYFLIRPDTVLRDWFIFRRENEFPMIVEIFIHHNRSEEMQFVPLQLNIVSQAGYLVPENVFAVSTIHPVYEEEHIISYPDLSETHVVQYPSIT
jgi:hypothetical protein